MRTLSTILALALLSACDHRTAPAPQPGVAPVPPPSLPSQAQASATATASATAPAAPSASAAAAPVSVPLGPPGATISLVPPDDDGTSYGVVVTEAGKTTTYQYTAFRADVKPQFRHVDVNGDGRADTVFFFPTSSDHATTGGTAVLTPPPAQQRADSGDDDYIAGDFATTLLSVGASSLDDVVARAKTIPAKGVTGAEACALLRRASTVAGFRAVATPDARIILSGEPGDPSQGSLYALADIGKRDASYGNHSGAGWPLASHAREWCKTMNPSAHDGSPDCEKHRPACQYGQAEGAVFAWTPEGQLRLQAVLSFDM